MAIALIPSLSGGGAERQVLLLHKHKVFDYIITLENYVDYDQVDAKKIIHLSNHTPDTNVIWRYLFIPIYIWRLFQVCKRLNQEIIVSFLFRADIVNVCSKWLIRRQHFMSIRNNPVMHYEGKRKIMRHLIKYVLFPLSSGIISNAQEINFILHQTLKFKSSKLHFIENAIDGTQIKKMMHSSNSREIILNSPSLLAMGRFAQQKGFIELMDVIKKVVADIPNLNAYIVGKGPLKKQLDQIIVDYDLQNNVTLMPFQSNPYVLMKQVDVFVLPSFYEGMPNILLEALACGCQIISTNCACGTKEILLENHHQFNTQSFKSRIAHVVPILGSPESIGKMAEKAIAVLTKNSLPFSKGDINQTVMKYEIQHVKKKWLKFFEDL